jgi:hypothetical protein
MRRLAFLAIVLASFALVQCGESLPPVAPGQLPTPPGPTPGPLPRHSISGVVVDGWTQLPLGGVTVSTAGPTVTSTTTDENGRYTLANLLPGTYTILLSKPLFRTRTYQSVLVSSDTTHDGRIGLDVPSTYSSADLTGLWVGHGPYRDEPLWLTLIERGGSFEGLYQDRSVSSRAVSGRREGNHVWLRIDVPGSPLTVEGDVLEDRCLRGVVKNEALGGNFPIMFARVAPAFCAR